MEYLLIPSITLPFRHHGVAHVCPSIYVNVLFKIQIEIDPAMPIYIYKNDDNHQFVLYNFHRVISILALAFYSASGHQIYEFCFHLDPRLSRDVMLLCANTKTLGVVVSHSSDGIATRWLWATSKCSSCTNPSQWSLGNLTSWFSDKCRSRSVSFTGVSSGTLISLLFSNLNISSFLSPQKAPGWTSFNHYTDVIMTTIASQITSLTVVYSIVYSDADQRKHQSSASLAFVWGIHRDRWIPRTKDQLRGKCLHLMTSSWMM